MMIKYCITKHLTITLLNSFFCLVLMSINIHWNILLPLIDMWEWWNWWCCNINWAGCYISSFGRLGNYYSFDFEISFVSLRCCFINWNSLDIYATRCLRKYFWNSLITLAIGSFGSHDSHLVLLTLSSYKHLFTH